MEEGGRGGSGSVGSAVGGAGAAAGQASGSKGALTPRSKTGMKGASTKGKRVDKRKGKVKQLLKWMRSSLVEEERNFRYSPWFIAPMLIATILLVFFFIRMLYMMDSLHNCIGSSRCPGWTSFNGAVVPIISAVFHATLTTSSPAHYVKQLNRELIAEPANELLVRVENSFKSSAIHDRLIVANFYTSIPGELVTRSNHTLQLLELTKAAETTYFISADGRKQVRLGPKAKAVIGRKANGTTEVYEVRVDPKKKTLHEAVVVNGSQWSEFYLRSATFDDLLRDTEDAKESLLRCNIRAVLDYVDELTWVAVQDTYLHDELRDAANLFGMPPFNFIRQFFYRALRHVLVETACPMDDPETPLLLALMSSESTSMSNLLDRWFPRTRAFNETLLAQYNDTALSELNSTASAALNFTLSITANVSANISNAITMGYLEELKDLRKYEAANREFFNLLQAAFRVGGLVGPILALAVSVASLVVIMGVYKTAVVRLRKQLAINKLLEALPEGKGLLQGKALLQRKFLADTYALDQGSNAEGSIKMFTMVEALKGQALGPVSLFYAMVFSCVLIQLVFCSVMFSGVITLLLHPWFWKNTFPYVMCFVVAWAASKVFMNLFVGGFVGDRFVTPNGTIGNLSAWTAYFIITSFANIILGLLLGLFRINLILMSALIMSCRMDRCLNGLHQMLDPAYDSFMAMMKVQIQLKAVTDQEEDAVLQLQAAAPGPLQLYALGPATGAGGATAPAVMVSQESLPQGLAGGSDVAMGRDVGPEGSGSDLRLEIK